MCLNVIARKIANTAISAFSFSIFTKDKER